MNAFIISFQAGEIFSSAQNKAVSQQRDLGIQSNTDGSIDSPLLLEQVHLFIFYFISLHSILSFLLMMLSKFMFCRRQQIHQSLLSWALSVALLLEKKQCLLKGFYFGLLGVMCFWSKLWLKILFLILCQERRYQTLMFFNL